MSIAGQGAAIDDPCRSRPPSQVLAWGREFLDPGLREAVGGLPPLLRSIAQYHFGWLDERGQPACGGNGKAIRPTLVLVSAQAVGGSAAEALAAAVATELVHNSSLLHDDVIDRDPSRRHRPSVWSVFGLSAAILAGDALSALALDVLAATNHEAAVNGMRMLNAAFLDLLGGQSADVSFEERDDVDSAECQSMSASKTGALMGCACALGALFGRGSPEQIEHLRGFGEALGLAFQFVDDLKGIWGDPVVTGKPAYSDLHNRKKSLPVVAALTSRTPAGRQLAALYDRKDPLSETDLIQAARLIDLSGGRAWVEAQADALLDQALRHLAAADLAAQPAAELTALAELATRRSGAP